MPGVSSPVEKWILPQGHPALQSGSDFLGTRRIDMRPEYVRAAFKLIAFYVLFFTVLTVLLIAATWSLL
jgi:hypothetical protein